jgi:predicted AlkP superfamily pyrophosphatase or phosphodiesterase
LPIAIVKRPRTNDANKSLWSDRLKNWSWLLLITCSSALAAGSGGINAPDQRDKPYLILVSIDGFRWDYQDLYHTPALDRIASGGVRADAMIPIFPTLTFPNHYSIATGLYPANHGLIGNKFPSKDRARSYSMYDRDAVMDGTWYGGNPIWVAAENEGLVTAAYYFVGTEAPISGVPLTYWHAFDASVAGEARIDQAIEWLSMPDDSRPHLITLYFEDVDTTTHRYGPGSAESIEAVKRVDGYLARLLSGVDELPIGDDVYVVIVSDHGQTASKLDERPFIIDSVVSLDGLTVVDHGSSTFIYLPEPDNQLAAGLRDAINESWTHGKAMLRSDTPKAWRVSSSAGFADVILQADPGYTVFSTSRLVEAIPGNHGWAPEFEEMFGIFLAMGPDLPAGLQLAAINNVDVYPLMMKILDLPITTPIDGDPELLPDLLQPQD